MQELEYWKTKFDIVGSATEGFFSKQWLAKRLFGMSDDEFIRNRREMFYDKRFEAALETAGEAEQAEATADLNAGPDAAGDLGEPGGVGAVGAEPELGVPTEDPAAAAAAPAADAAAPADDGAPLAAPQVKRRLQRQNNY